MKEEIVDIINGTAPVEVAPPTPGELRRAERRGNNQTFQNPPAKGTGGWCILLALHHVRGYLQVLQRSSLLVQEHATPESVLCDDAMHPPEKWCRGLASRQLDPYF
jgi:hypothetical protein